MSWSRRDILIGAGLSAALGGAVLWRLTPDQGPGPTVALVDRAAAARIGRRLLESARPPADGSAAGQRIDTLIATLPAGTRAGDLRPALADWVAADFEQRRMVEVEGWYLARTEADLAILAALEEAGAQTG